MLATEKTEFAFENLPDATVTIEGLRALRHALGVNPFYPRADWAHRNYYVSSCPRAALDQLVSAGLMARQNYGPRYLYRVTIAGMQLAGLSDAQIAKLSSREATHER